MSKAAVKLSLSFCKQPVKRELSCLHESRSTPIPSHVVYAVRGSVCTRWVAAVEEKVVVRITETKMREQHLPVKDVLARLEREMSEGVAPSLIILLTKSSFRGRERWSDSGHHGRSRGRNRRWSWRQHGRSWCSSPS